MADFNQPLLLSCRRCYESCLQISRGLGQSPKSKNVFSLKMRLFSMLNFQTLLLLSTINFLLSCFYLVFILFLRARKPTPSKGRRGSETTDSGLSDYRFRVSSTGNDYIYFFCSCFLWSYMVSFL